MLLQIFDNFVSMSQELSLDYDFIVMGSGFGGSVSALRLSQKGYRVLVIEQGRRFGPDDFPKTNWNVRKWFWMPGLGFRGFFRIRMFRHMTVLAGAGVGGGSLVYANTLPVPTGGFFSNGHWARLLDWERELKPYYQKAAEMLGAVPNPHPGPADRFLGKLAEEMGLESRFEATRAAVFFGEPEKVVPDPYFGGKGSDREGCRFCGGCMVGCRYNAKNTLDKNYLSLAADAGMELWEQIRVTRLHPLGETGEQGYEVSVRTRGGKRRVLTARAFVFSGGVLGTVPLLLKLKRRGLPRLSDRVGMDVRTNSEALIGVISRNPETDFSEGIAIGSILHTDEFSHLEPVRYPNGSGFWRLLMAPMISGASFPVRLGKLLWDFARHPRSNFKAFTVRNWAKSTTILLFMQTHPSTLSLVRGVFGLSSRHTSGQKPSAFIPEAQELAWRYARLVNGKPLVLPTESLFGIPTTAHILGGACMGSSEADGVIDRDHKVFGYKNLYVIDGSAISANPGVNPSLTIAALAERAMDQIPPKII